MAAGGELVSRSGLKTGDRRRRITEAPMGGMISTVPAADAGCITLSTNITMHPSV